MSSNNSFSLLILFSLLLSFILDSAALKVSCLKHCGEIEIPYPFGVGKGCYMEKWYEITCVNSSFTSGKVVPFLSVINKEVVNISLPSNMDNYYYYSLGYGSVRIKNPITSKGCSSKGEELGSLLNLTGTPFYLNNTNTLIAVGCNITASLTNVEPSIVGCKSSCSTNYHTPTKDYLAVLTCHMNDYEYGYCNEKISVNETSCNGIRCCKANMPNMIQQIVDVRIDNTMTTGGCNVAFLTDESYSSSSGSDPQRLHAKRYSTVGLGWFIHTTNRSFIKSLECYNVKEYMNLTGTPRRSCVCDLNAYLSYARCSCIRGFEGNPYRLDECKDINECQLKDLDGTPRCSEGTCVNLRGDYHCVYTNHRPLAIGIGSSFGSLIFVGGVYSLQENSDLATTVFVAK